MVSGKGAPYVESLRLMHWVTQEGSSQEGLLRLQLSDIALERHSRIVCDCHQSGMCTGTPFPPAQGSKLDSYVRKNSELSGDWHWVGTKSTLRQMCHKRQAFPCALTLVHTYALHSHA